MTEVRDARPLDAPDSDALRFLPEGPCALGDSQFSWVAIQHGNTTTVGSLNLYDLNTANNQSFELPGRPGFAFPCSAAGKFVIGCERTLGIFDTSTGKFETLAEGVDADVDNTIINDGLVFEDNLIFGTKDLEFTTKKAGLYLYRGADKQLIRLRDDQICSNGKAIRRCDDGGIELIDIDSPTREVVAYRIDIAAGTLGQSRVLLDLTDDPAVPDGAMLTPDERGLIVSMFLPKSAEFGETRQYDLSSGKLQCAWRTPGSPQNTCPALVRHNGAVMLVITTAMENMSRQDRAMCPWAGQLFVGRTDFESLELPPLYPLT